ncbi:MAG: gluconokinase [Rubrimonas sp.]
MTLRAVIMGVAGCGKSTVGAALAERLGVAYQDGDLLHPPANVAKMRAGRPLTDRDRAPWLDLVAAALRDRAPLIVGCSALRRIYRDRIRAGAGGPVRFIHLTGDRALIAARMAARTGHYMPLSLLDSQFAALEAPDPEEQALTVPIDQPLDTIVAAVADALAPAPKDSRA